MNVVNREHISMALEWDGNPNVMRLLGGITDDDGNLNIIQGSNVITVPKDNYIVLFKNGEIRVHNQAEFLRTYHDID